MKPNHLNGFKVESTWKRVYPYENTLRQILGNISSSKNGIPSELLDKFSDDDYYQSSQINILEGLY